VFAKQLLAEPFTSPLPDLGDRLWQFAYGLRERGRYRHVVALHLAPNIDNVLALSLLRCMHNNQALVGLLRGKHYQWGGMSTIGFRSKQHTSLFIMFAITE
jgi:hypothetical protein